MGSLHNAANVKTGLPLFELERQAGIIYRNDGNDWNRSDLSIGNLLNYLNAVCLSASALRLPVASFPGLGRR